VQVQVVLVKHIQSLTVQLQFTMQVAEAVLPEECRLQALEAKVAVVQVQLVEVKTQQQTVAAVAAAVKEMT
jgi:hypothetical protein